VNREVDAVSQRSVCVAGADEDDVSGLVSAYGPLFGFMESGYRVAIVLTLLFDGLTTVFLGAFLLNVGTELIRPFTTARRVRT